MRTGNLFTKLEDLLHKTFLLNTLCIILCVSVCRGQRLEESLEYQQFVANVEEEEAWINEKLNLVGSEDYGDTLAAVQVHIHLQTRHLC